ncbi:related to Reticuline oxidase precursor [Ustilago sp. UG-2017b]|nr:related to Reticuline oxidase precursor [Ustilago sp. UG-2017b]
MFVQPPLPFLLTALFATVSFISAFPLTSFDSTLLLPRDTNTTSLHQLQSCLSNIPGSPQISYPSSPTFRGLSSSYNPLFPYSPLLIALPSTEAQLTSIIRCTSSHHGSYKLSPRSGAHSYTSYSLGGSDGSVIIDLSHLSTICIDHEEKQVSVGAGLRLGTLALTLDKAGFALPHGLCPMVGIGGHALGGGFGFTTRAWGFLVDRITEMRMVDAQGVVRVVDKDSKGEEERELWWGLRGGGANQFGIVTQFTFSLETAPSQVLNYVYSYRSNQDCAKAIVALQTLTLSPTPLTGLEPDLGGRLILAGKRAGDFNNNACQFYGQHLHSSRSHHDSIVARFHTLAGISPTQVFVKPFTRWTKALEDIMGSLDVNHRTPESDHEQFYAKSLIQPPIATYTYTSALSLVAKLDNYAGLQATGNTIQLDFLGPLSYPFSQAERVTGKAVFNARKAGFLYQFYSYGFPPNNNKKGQEEVHKAFDDLVDTAKQSGTAKGVEWGSYVNYVDSRLKDWGKEYYGVGVERLKRLKSRLDPEGMFWFPQSITNA